MAEVQHNGHSSSSIREPVTLSYGLATVLFQPQNTFSSLDLRAIMMLMDIQFPVQSRAYSMTRMPHPATLGVGRGHCPGCSWTSSSLYKAGHSDGTSCHPWCWTFFPNQKTHLIWTSGSESGSTVTDASTSSKQPNRAKSKLVLF